MVGTIGDVSVVVFNDVVSVVISGANSWEKQMVLMSVSLNGGAGCWSELLDLLLPLWSFFVLLLSVISITSFISRGTKNMYCVTPERATSINRLFIYNDILLYQICDVVW